MDSPSVNSQKQSCQFGTTVHKADGLSKSTTLSGLESLFRARKCQSAPEFTSKYLSTQILRVFKKEKPPESIITSPYNVKGIRSCSQMTPVSGFPHSVSEGDLYRAKLDWRFVEDSVVEFQGQQVVLGWTRQELLAAVGEGNLFRESVASLVSKIILWVHKQLQPLAELSACSAPADAVDTEDIEEIPDAVKRSKLADKLRKVSEQVFKIKAGGISLLEALPCIQRKGEWSCNPQDLKQGLLYDLKVFLYDQQHLSGKLMDCEPDLGELHCYICNRFCEALETVCKLEMKPLKGHPVAQANLRDYLAILKSLARVASRHKSSEEDCLILQCAVNQAIEVLPRVTCEASYFLSSWRYCLDLLVSTQDGVLTESSLPCFE